MYEIIEDVQWLRTKRLAGRAFVVSTSYSPKNNFTMGKQAGVVQINGAVGNMSFYKTKDGYRVRMKGGVSAERIATDPKFARTRENLSEFGRAGKGGKLLRTALQTVIKQASDSGLVRRLTKHMMIALKGDLTSPRGMRNLTEGNTALLEGFEFNTGSPLSTSLFAPYTASIDRVTGILKVDLPSYVPEISIAAPPSATHYVLHAAGAELDFANNLCKGDIASSLYLPINNAATDPLSLSVNLEANSFQPLFLALGISYLQMVNGEPYVMNNGTFNALALVKVSHA